MRKWRWELLTLAGLIGFLAIYFSVLTSLIPEIYNGTAPKWINNLVDFIYPRFAVEKHRLSEDFFLEKGNQLVLRCSFLVMCAIGYSMLVRSSEGLLARQTEFWEAKISYSEASLIPVVYFGSLFLSIPDWIFSLYDYTRLAEFYRPILIFKMLNISLPSQTAVTGLLFSFVLANTFVFVKKWEVPSATISTLLFLLFQGYFLCFGKVVHTYSPIIYASLIAPFFISDWAKQRRVRGDVPVWALRLMQFGVAICYLYSGLEKVFTAGWHWLSGQQLVAHLQMAEQPLGLWLSQQIWLCQIGSVIILTWQLSFPVAVFVPKTKWLFIVGGLIFHWATYLLLGVGGWWHPWFWGYFLFLSPELLWLKNRFSKWVVSNHQFANS